MKKLITVILIASAATLFAETTPNEPYCECKGIGLPERKYPQLKVTPSTEPTQKFKSLNYGQYILYQLQLAFWLNPFLMK